MHRPFDNPRAVAPFAEPVAVCAHRADSDGVSRVGTVRAAVLLGASDTLSAGPSANPKTADLYTVSVSRREWDTAFPFPPRFGMRFETATFGVLVVDAVTTGESYYDCRCSAKMKARER